MNELMGLIRSDLRNFTGYSSARDEATQGSIWLNANESPYEREVQQGININRYPEKQSKQLKAQLASINHLATNQILLSRGSDEAIDLIIRLFCTAGIDSIIQCPPTYGMYSVYARLQGAQVIELPLLKDQNYQLNLPAILESINQNVKIIFVCSPNNPTGNLIKQEDITYLCRAVANKCLIVVDEAYIEYADASSCARYINQFNNLVILRTFSKAYGLAGARLGYVMAHSYIIQCLLKIIAPYPLPWQSIQLGLHSLSSDNLAIVQQQIACIKSQRERLYQLFIQMPIFTRVWTSDANYLLVEAKDPDYIMQQCAKQGIILRSMVDKLGLQQCLRISIGTPEENTFLIEVLVKLSHPRN